MLCTTTRTPPERQVEVAELGDGLWEYMRYLAEAEREPLGLNASVHAILS